MTNARGFLLSADERRQLGALSRSPRAADARRARLVLLLGRGMSWQAICAELPCTPDYIRRWKTRFATERLDGLRPKHRGRPASLAERQTEAQVIAATRLPPPDGAVRWTMRSLGAALGISHMRVQRIWERRGLGPAGALPDPALPNAMLSSVTKSIETRAPLPKPRLPAPAAAVQVPARRTQRERRESTRRQLVAAAIDCICEYGFAGASSAAIADRAGVSRGAVQHHFGTRDRLLLAILEDLRGKLVARAPRAATSGTPVADRLDALLEQYWDIINSRHFIATVQIQLGTVNNRELYPDVFKLMHKSVTQLDRDWVAIFAEHDIPPERVMAARHLALATFRGLAVRQVYRSSRDGWAAERSLLKEMLRNALTRAPSPR